MNLRISRLAGVLLTLIPITAMLPIKLETHVLQLESQRRGTTKPLHPRLTLRLPLFSLLVLLALGFGNVAPKSTRWSAPHNGEGGAGLRPANSPASRPVEPDAGIKQRISTAYGRMPLWFEKNEGQTDSSVQFLSRGSGYTLFLSAGGEAALALSGPASAGDDTLDSSRSVKVATAGATLPDIPSNARTSRRDTDAALFVKPVGANKKTHAEGEAAQSGTVNYFRGSDQTKWRTGISTFARVSYENVYPGVDLVYYGNQRQLEYDFIVHPGADPGIIGLDFEGADGLTVDPEGDLVAQIAGREVRQRRPLIYQEEGGVRHEIAGGYTLTGKRTIRFQLAAYDTTKPLVIDPVLVYSTFLGGSAFDQSFAIALDATGNAYVTGLTRPPVSPTPFPTTASAFDTTFGGGDNDVFVSKLDVAGATLVYSTFLGGNGADHGEAIAVDTAGNAYVAGRTSGNFPTTGGAFDTTFNSPGPGSITTDGFVTKLSATGSSLVYSTYLGGTGDDSIRGLAVDTAGSAYVTGSSFSSNFPTTPGAYLESSPTGGSFVTKLDATGAALVYSTYLGGSGESIAIDAAGSAYVSAYVVGATRSSDFPTTVGAYDTSFNGIEDASITKLDVTGATLVYSTYLGGSSNDGSIGIAVDAAGNAYVTGFTRSSDFPTTSGAYDTSLNGIGDAFVTKLSVTGAALVDSTFLGGSDSVSIFDTGQAIAVDAAGSAYVTGNTVASDFPTTAGAFDTSWNGMVDGFVTKLLPTPDNTPPTITAAASVTLQQDAGLPNSLIATVNDTEDAETALAVTVDGLSSATTNGVSVSNIAIDSAGHVKADVAAACGATGASFTLRVTDTGSLFANATLNVAVTLETTPPVINPISPVVVTLPLNSVATSMPVTFPLPTATDNCSGATVVTNPVSGTVFNVGTTTVNVTATDGLGNTATSSFTVTVLYNFAGFFLPVDNPPTFNGAKAGQAIPVKFSLSGNKGPNIFAVGFPTSVVIPCPSGSGALIEEIVAASGSSLQYDSGTDRYNYVWKTDASWSGSCRQLILKLNDGSTLTANFQFR